MEQIDDARQIRGIEIAEKGGIKQVDLNTYVVPTQWGSGNYKVNFGEKGTCDCPDCQTRHIKCKHQWAVEYFLKWQRDGKGNVTVTQIKRITYPQDWENYNRAQSSEIELFDKLLRDLVQSVEEDTRVGPGRPGINLRDSLYCAVEKVYSQLSQRRAHSLYKKAMKEGRIEHAPHFNAAGKVLNREDVMPVLQELLRLSSLPLKSIEKDFAVDSSGFRTTQFNEYCKEKHKTGKKHKWLKAHIMSGVKTNVITAARVTRDYSHDTNEFKPLVRSTSEGFEIKEVSADKAYSSKDNLSLVDELGGTPYIPFKENARGRTRGGSPIWKKMYYYFQFNNEEFMSHYHKRSNAETVFHMVKMKFGDKVRSKNRIAQENELMCKFIAHNICVVIQEMFELGIQAGF